MFFGPGSMISSTVLRMRFFACGIVFLRRARGRVTLIPATGSADLFAIGAIWDPIGVVGRRLETRRSARVRPHARAANPPPCASGRASLSHRREARSRPRGRSRTLARRANDSVAVAAPAPRSPRRSRPRRIPPQTSGSRRRQGSRARSLARPLGTTSRLVNGRHQRTASRFSGPSPSEPEGVPSIRRIGHGDDRRRAVMTGEGPRPRPGRGDAHHDKHAATVGRRRVRRPLLAGACRSKVTVSRRPASPS